ncbi:MAG: hypothetical protein BMS9Abin28_2030 [Anaerolineae bacterium]|nr:MAG: hypothetical protein BMS9Abin28_2030 [Anaerolineae bacterium]
MEGWVALGRLGPTREDLYRGASAFLWNWVDGVSRLGSYGQGILTAVE